MSDLYSKASLVMNPQLVDTGKVYSIKPEDRKGDFTFTRSSAATRVNADGFIEKETQNLLVQSNNFATTWGRSNTSVTGGQSSYDGSSDAWLLSKSAASGQIGQNTTSSGVNTFSVYAKANVSPYVRLTIFEGGFSANGTAYFDLQNGVLGTTNAIDSSIENVGNGWYRCSVTFNTSNQKVYIYPADGDNDTSGTSGSIYIQDAQLNQGLIAQEVITTTTTAVEGGITDNVPRLDYTDSSCPALLLEPQRTNQVLYSEYGGPGYWSKLNSTTTNNAAISPEGVQNAFELTDNTSDGYHWIYKSAIDTGNNHRISFFAKSNTLSEVWANGGDGVKSARFNLSNGTIMQQAGGSQATIEDYGNGWYRCSFTADYGGILIATSKNGISTYAGTGQSIYMYGIQSESSTSYATSYIPTYGSSVTRVVDGSLDFSSSFSDVFGSASLTKYSILIDIKKAEQSSSATSTFLSKGSNAQGRINYGAGTSIAYYSTATSYMTFSLITDGNPHKYLLVANDGVIKQFFDGTLIDTGNNPNDEFVSFSLTGSIGSYADYGLSSLMTFNEAISNEEAIALTTI
jgi:hypothetical protein